MESAQQPALSGKASMTDPLFAHRLPCRDDLVTARTSITA